MEHTGAMSAAAPLIDTELAAFMEGGISLNIGAAGADLRPCVARALGCRVSADRRTVLLLLSCAQSAGAIERIGQNGRIAAVFSQPSTHRSIQLKGSDATVVPASAADVAVVRRYRHAFVRELEPIGFQPATIYAFLECADADLVGIRFTPDAAFHQTPGPGAGRQLGGTA